MSTASISLPDALGDAAREFVSGPHALLIGDERPQAADGRTFATLDPSSGREIARVAHAGRADADAAVARARAAFEGWSSAPAPERERLLFALAQAVESHAKELAQIESLDNGKPVKLAQVVHVRGTASHLRYFAGWPTKIEGAVLPVAAGAGMHCYTRREPVGVCAQIIPWNFPLLMASWKLAPALAAGCTVVLKPAEQTPLSALRLGELALEVGFPPGVINVLTGDGATGAALVEHPDVRQGRLHRLDRRRARDRSEGRARAQARHARAGRQVPQHHPARRRHRRRRRGRVSGDLLQLRPGLQRRLAPVRPRRAVRRDHQRAGRACRRHARSARAWSPRPSWDH